VIYDAMLHAVFVGFVLSMVFAHAPIIFPAVLGVPLVYRRSSYLHVAVLHLSLTARVIGDLVDVLGRWRSWGGLLNAAALILFVVNTIRAIDRPSARPIPRTAAVPRP
jgi:ABC-type Mn2+/Zn2+ transport system permease subunit